MPPGGYHPARRDTGYAEVAGQVKSDVSCVSPAQLRQVATWVPVPPPPPQSVMQAVLPQVTLQVAGQVCAQVATPHVGLPWHVHSGDDLPGRQKSIDANDWFACTVPLSGSGRVVSNDSTCSASRSILSFLLMNSPI